MLYRIVPGRQGGRLTTQLPVAQLELNSRWAAALTKGMCKWWCAGLGGDLLAWESAIHLLSCNEWSVSSHLQIRVGFSSIYPVNKPQDLEFVPSCCRNVRLQLQPKVGSQGGSHSTAAFRLHLGLRMIVSPVISGRVWSRGNWICFVLSSISSPMSVHMHTHRWITDKKF